MAEVEPDEKILILAHPAIDKEIGDSCELWSKTTVCRVTSTLGTDLSFQLKDRPAPVTTTTLSLKSIPIAPRQELP